MSQTDTDDEDKMQTMVAARIEGDLMRRYVSQAEEYATSNKSDFLRHVIREGLTRLEQQEDIETMIRETIRDELADADSDTSNDHYE